MSTRTHTRYAPLYGDADVLYAQALDILYPLMNTVINSAWNCDGRGAVMGAVNGYKGLAKLQMLADYGYMLYTECVANGTVRKTCNTYELEFKFKITCIEANLKCFSLTYGVDFVNAWKDIAAIYSLDRTTKTCGEAAEALTGVYSPCEHQINGYEQPTGDTTSLYTCL